MSDSVRTEAGPQLVVALHGWERAVCAAGERVTVVWPAEQSWALRG